MLIRFSVENFLSFKDEVEFSMIAGKSHQHPEHVVSEDKRGSLKILKAGVLYGANASGKSNLIKAMDFAQKLILRGRRPNQTIAVTPFKLMSDYEKKPSKFQFEFKFKGKSYIYGFRLDAQKIYEEWLYQITPTTEKLIFERTTSESDQTQVEFSTRFKAKDLEFLEFTARGTRPNQLFLTESIERNIDFFKDAFNWFKDVLVVLFPESRLITWEIEFMTDEDFQESFSNFVRLFDTGISGIDLIEFRLDDEVDIPIEFREKLIESLTENDSSTVMVRSSAGRQYAILKDEKNEIKALRLVTTHQAQDENRHVQLELDEESDGTQRLFDLIPALMELITGQRVFVIDELDRSLHPHLSYELLRLFLTNSRDKMTQLIVTTHESGLLDLDLLRRDEIWFVEKDPEGASSLYSLEEFAPRYDNDIRKGYLLGRFGAIPFIQPVENLGWLK